MFQLSVKDLFNKTSRYGRDEECKTSQRVIKKVSSVKHILPERILNFIMPYILAITEVVERYGANFSELFTFDVRCMLSGYDEDEDAMLLEMYFVNQDNIKGETYGTVSIEDFREAVWHIQQDVIYKLKLEKLKYVSVTKSCNTFIGFNILVDMWLGKIDQAS